VKAKSRAVSCRACLHKQGQTAVIRTLIIVATVVQA
jgi:hypothetical protein